MADVHCLLFSFILFFWQMDNRSMVALLMCVVARAKFQLVSGIKGHNGYISMLAPNVLKGKSASVQMALDGQGVSGASLSDCQNAP